MEIKLTIPAKYIAVLKLFAAEKDSRIFQHGQLAGHRLPDALPDANA